MTEKKTVEKIEGHPQIDPRLAEKIFNVMRDAKSIKKSGWNKFQKYKYATEEDVIKAVKPLLVTNRLLVIKSDAVCETTPIHSTVAGTGQLLTHIFTTYKWVDVDTGYYVESGQGGTGVDSGDKGIYKAFTGANKYQLEKMLQLPTTDDPEADDKVDEDNPPPEEGINWRKSTWNGTCKACGNAHIKKGETVVAKVDDKWVAEDCYKHLQSVENSSPPEEKSQQDKLKQTLSEMDIDATYDAEEPFPPPEMYKTSGSD